MESQDYGNHATLAKSDQSVADCSLPVSPVSLCPPPPPPVAARPLSPRRSLSFPGRMTLAVPSQRDPARSLVALTAVPSSRLMRDPEAKNVEQTQREEHTRPALATVPLAHRPAPCPLSPASQSPPNQTSNSKSKSTTKTLHARFWPSPPGHSPVIYTGHLAFFLSLVSSHPSHLSTHRDTPRPQHTSRLTSPPHTHTHTFTTRHPKTLSTQPPCRPASLGRFESYQHPPFGRPDPSTVCR